MPTMTVPNAIVMMVRVSAARRPCVSPKRPIAMPPSGRIRKPTPEYGKRGQQSRGRVAGGEELLGDRAGEEDVDTEVIPFEHIADRGGDHRLASHAAQAL